MVLLGGLGVNAASRWGADLGVRVVLGRRAAAAGERFTQLVPLDRA